MRLFLALDFDEAARTALTLYVGEAEKILEDFRWKVRWTPPQNLHVTVVFLGELAPPLLPVLSASLRTTANSYGVFELHFTLPGFFPPLRRRPRVFHVQDEERGGSVQHMHSALLSTCGRLVPALDQKPFVPHVTLARILREGGPQVLEQLAPCSIRVPFSHVVLMDSELTPKGPLYHRLEHFPLGGPNEV
ncbi:MAG: 2'-5' RNA ligase [Deltaproteobacteria bacterium RIFOXYA12_FULL_61_11]|nr:MAG: 2'-5' RNA ligase [Deltaproteobacteria bacterium RIFOXYA12_FULL_61_11]